MSFKLIHKPSLFIFMLIIKKLFFLVLLLLLLGSCGFSKRIHFTLDNKIAVSPRGYSAKAYKNLDDNKIQRIQKRKRTFMVSLIVTTNILIFAPLLISQSSQPTER